MHVDPAVERMTAADPGAKVPVVVTLARGAAEDLSALGMSGAKQIAPGIYAAELTADEIEQLSRQGSVEAIEADRDVQAFE
jgi:hypothetical protein